MNAALSRIGRLRLLLLLAVSAVSSRAADVLISTTNFNYVGETTQSYYVPKGADAVVVTVWSGGSNASGALVTASFSVHAGNAISVTVGSGPPTSGLPAWPTDNTSLTYAGGYSLVQLPSGSARANSGGYNSYNTPVNGTATVSGNYGEIVSGLATNTTTSNYPYGGAIIRAYKRSIGSDPLLRSTYVGYTNIGAEARTLPALTIPSSTAYLVIKAWGGGGEGSPTSAGGAGAYVMGIFATTHENIAGAVASTAASISSVRNGGQRTVVNIGGSGKLLHAAGGGAAGAAPNAAGGIAGAPNGGDGGPGYSSVAATGGKGDGTAGAGGTGNGLQVDEDENGHVSSRNPYGHGQNGHSDGTGGWPGYTDDAVDDNGDVVEGGDIHYNGGAGGSGYAGGGGGGTGTAGVSNVGVGGAGGGGGGGGSSFATSNAALVTLMLSGSGVTPPGTSDPDYPGSNVAAGGTSTVAPGPGAVVILAYPAGGSAPTVTTSTSQSFGQNHATSLSVTTTGNPLFYTATGLPPGLVLDRLTGLINGTPTTQGTYTSTISATNPYGTGQATITWTIVAPDTSPPSVPTGLQTTTTSFSAMTLAWAASTDDVGIYGYEVQQDGKSLDLVRDATTLDVSGLALGTTYTFKVRARDSAGNWSDWSSPLSAILTDSTPPSAPAVLNYADKTATSVTLIWTVASDNIGVTGYSIYRGGTLIGSTSDLAFADSGLTANTAYSYTVKAFDAAGNVSGASPSLSVTTTQDFSTDADGDGIPDSMESALGTNGASAATRDTTNQTQQNIHRPLQ
jgi:chitodextrinase